VHRGVADALGLGEVVVDESVKGRLALELGLDHVAAPVPVGGFVGDADDAVDALANKDARLLAVAGGVSRTGFHGYHRPRPRLSPDRIEDFRSMLLARISPEVLTAFATLCGAGVGGILAGGVTLRVDGRRHARERIREQEKQHRELRVSARLVDEELREATNLIRDAVYQGRFWPATRALSVTQYERHRAPLAAELGDLEWANVSLAYAELRRLESEAEGNQPVRYGELEPSVSALARLDIGSVGLAIVQARQALAPLANPPDHEQLLTMDSTDLFTMLFPMPDEDVESGDPPD